MKFIANDISIQDDDTHKYTQNPGHSGRSLKNKVSHSVQQTPTPLHYPTLPLESRGRSQRFQVATRHDDLHGNGPPLPYRFFCLANIYVPPTNWSALQSLCSLFIFLSLVLYSHYSFISPLYSIGFLILLQKYSFPQAPVFHFFYGPTTTKSK